MPPLGKPLSGSAREDTLSLLPTAFSCLVLWSLHKLRGNVLPLPSLCQPALAPLPRVGCCVFSRPGWLAYLGTEAPVQAQLAG